MQSYKKKKAFFATQWPLEDTVIDFWRMVSDYEVCNIVILEHLAAKVN